MQAFTLTRAVVPFGDTYPIRDAEIIACNPEAAELYGYASPDELVGRMLSDSQSIAERYRGRAAFVLRRLGHKVTRDYCSEIVRPDGESIWVRKLVERKRLQSHAGKVFVTRLEIVRQPSDALPDPARFGVCESQIREAIGYTIREAAEPKIQDLLHCTKNLRKLLSDYAHLMSRVDGPLFSWSRETDHVVRRVTCPNCGFIRFCALTTKHPKCWQCRKQPGRKGGKRNKAGRNH